MALIDSISPKPENGGNGAKILYGQAYICKDALVQDLIYVWPGGKITQATIELIKNIWDDLTSASTKIKSNGKSYFYWPVTMSTTDDVTVEVRIEAPKPKPGLWKEPFEDIKESNEWVKFYKAKIITSKENYEEEYAIQKKNISMPGCEYISQTGETIKLENLKVSNNSLGDIENLLSLF